MVYTSTYTAFGERLASLYDDSYTRFGFAGAWGYEESPDIEDLENGQDVVPFLHLGHRYYDPAIGRFLQRDPIGFRGGVNQYAYVFNIPTNGVDPTGEGFWDGDNGFHDWIARKFWMNKYNPAKNRLPVMGDGEAALWVCGYTAIGTATVYYAGKPALRWLNRGKYRIGRSGPWKGRYYISYRSPKIRHKDLFRIPKWWDRQIW